MAADNFSEQPTGLVGPALNAFSVTAHDSDNFSDYTRALYVGGAGDASVVMASGDTVTLVGLLAGTVYPLQLMRVNSTGTTATNMVGLY